MERRIIRILITLAVVLISKVEHFASVDTHL
jgi:hypothetical protein